MCEALLIGFIVLIAIIVITGDGDPDVYAG
jgi:hypothetical protein